ncbi:MAG: tetratricopeptide repeat-containing glycosyltransferase family protein [Xanthobacteraceae bacterium]
MARQATAQPSRSGPSIEEALKLHQSGQLADADNIYRAILDAEPAHCSALHLSGLVKYEQGDFPAALRLVAAALNVKSGSPELLMDHGVILQALNRFDESLSQFDQLLNEGVDDARLHYNRGNALKSLGRYCDALASYDRALALAPDLLVAHQNRAATLAGLNRNEDALAAYDRVLECVDPADRISLLMDRSRILSRLKRYEEAWAGYGEVLALRPDDAEALAQRGVILTELGRPDEALAQYEQALRVDPDSIIAHLNRGNALGALNRLDEARQSYDEVLARNPDHADANFNAALVRLCLGDFRRGWPQYEYRWKRERYAAARPVYPRPIWSGKQDIRGKTVLLCAEQGFGDAIQFSRYATVMAKLGAKVMIGAHRPLAPVLATVPGVAQVIPDGDELPHFDFYCSLLSLPLAFSTEPATIPAHIPYVTAQDERVAKWRHRLPANGRVRVGICWAGTGEHSNNRNRSMTLERFATMFSIPGVDFVSLQKEVGDDQAAILQHFNVIQLGQEFTDFVDTAAVVAMLDIVVSVDTSVAHLAGAMGKATAVLIPFAPDWRWMLHRTDSPWYPTMRLYRQSTIHDWSEPIARIHHELSAVANRVLQRQANA